MVVLNINGMRLRNIEPCSRPHDQYTTGLVADLYQAKLTSNDGINMLQKGTNYFAWRMLF